MSSHVPDLESGHQQRTSSATEPTVPLPVEKDETSNAYSARQSQSILHQTTQPQPPPILRNSEHTTLARPRSVPSPSNVKVALNPEAGLEVHGTLDLKNMVQPHVPHISLQPALNNLNAAAESAVNTATSAAIGVAREMTGVAHEMVQLRPSLSHLAQSILPPPPPNITQRHTASGAFNATHDRRDSRVLDTSLDGQSMPYDDDGRYLPTSPSGRVLNIGSLHNTYEGKNGSRAGPSSSAVGGGAGGSGGGKGKDRMSSEGSFIMPQFAPKVMQRLADAQAHAKREREKYERKSLFYGYAYHVAIGLQVFLSALITALSAVTSGKSTSIMTSVLGGISTIVASFLARIRGTNEPELSIQRVKDLQVFERELEAYIKDYGEESGPEHDRKVREFRRKFEYLLGNGDGERKMTTEHIRIN